MAKVYSPRPKKETRKKLGLFIVTLILLVIMGSGAWAYSLVRNLPNPSRITERNVVESTKIYDRTGKVLLYEIHGPEKRTVIPLSEIPGEMRQATLAAEDVNFYHHYGLDWKGIIRAFLKDIVSSSASQGGSTITQQLVKNTLLSGEKTFTRKIKEAILALAVESKYSKDEILELYLNQIPYGSNAYGVEAASQTYFAKSVSELTLAETATLAALPRAPTYYSPYGSHKNELLARKDWILDHMAEAGFINKSDAESTKKFPLVFALPKQSIRAPHFVMYVREYLDSKYGADFVEQGGLKVTTTLDWNLQEGAEKIIKDGADQNEKSVGAKNAALTALDPKTGDILVMVGSRDYFDIQNDGNVNVTTRARQPGSAFKPFVYATAFKKGYTPETVLMDVATEFNPLCNPDGTPGPEVSDPKTCYHPQDYDGKFRGPVTLRQALAQSLNAPSVKLLYLAGINDSIKTAQDLGITTLTDPNRYGLSLVLGGAEVTPLEMTSAFGAFAQDGILHPKSAILKIEDAQGNVLEEKKDSSLAVLDTQVARTINNILSDNDARVPIFNPHSSLYFPDRKVAAKTGTTQDYRDAWTIGYTPSLVAGVWAGNNDNTPMNQSALSVLVAAPIWHKFMDFALATMPPEDFIPPELGNAEKPVLRGIYRSGSVVKIDKISQKLATADTPPDLVEEKSYGDIKTILTYIKKDDPLGDVPAAPAADPQYKNWQEGIMRWLTTNQTSAGEPPKDYDNIHLPEKRPQITITAPTGNSVKEPLTEIVAKIQTTFPLQEVSLFINDELVDSKTNLLGSPTLYFELKNPLTEGSYQIKITAYDAVENTQSVQGSINVSK